MDKEPISKIDFDSIMEESETVLAELEERLTNVSVKIPSSHSDVIIAIQKVFGPKYINGDGSSVVTFEMFNQLVKSLRKVGEQKVGEYV